MNSLNAQDFLCIAHMYKNITNVNSKILLQSKQISKSSIVLTADEVADYTEKFRCVDHDGKGFITRLDISKLMEVYYDLLII